MDLDSVIKRQKQKEQEKNRNEWNPGNRKRTHFDKSKQYGGHSNKHQVEEVEISGSGSAHAEGKVISLSRRNNDLRDAKRQKVTEEGEGDEAAEGYEDQPTGYKGKKKPYYPPMGGYMPPMYDYSMYPMDPYMMPPYGMWQPYKKTFKNKSLIVKKDEGGKKAGAESKPSTE